MAFFLGVFVALAVLAAPSAARSDATRTAESGLVASVRSHAISRCGCALQGDPELNAAAREYSEIVASGAALDAHGVLRQSLSARGVLDPFPYVFYGSAPPERFGEVEERLLAQLARLPEAEIRLYTHVGIGIHARTRRRFLTRQVEWYVTVLLTQRAVSYSPLPRDPRPGERFLFEGEVHAPFREPQVLLTRPDGNTDVLDNFAVEPRRFRTYVCFGTQPGNYQLEIMGRYDMGPRVLGLASLNLRQPGEPSHYDVLLTAARSGTLVASAPRAAPPPASVADATALLFELVNRDRRRAGVPVLVEYAPLSAVARSHSEDMRDRGFFAHVSPRTGRLVERAESAGIAYVRIGENIAVGQNVREAQEALMRSPGHRMNLLDPEFTHLGVGIAFETDAQGRQRVFVTENFLVPPSD